MKSLLFLSCILFFILSINAQTNFDFEKFKFRYQSYKGLNLNSSLYQKSSSNDKPSGNQLDLSGNLNYFRFVNNDKIQRMTNAGFNFNPSVQTRSDVRTPKLNSSLSYNTVYRSYGAKNQFIGFEAYFYENIFSTRNTIIYPQRIFLNSNSQLTNNTSAKFTIGKGRSEYISDAVIAVRLFEELRSKNLLLREANTDDITGLGLIIISFNNTRVLDNRLNKIAMIEAMIGFLKTNNLINECGASTFAILNDQVYFATNTSRYAGKVNQLKAGVTLNNRISRIRTDSTSVRDFINDLTPEVVYSIVKYHPINVKNQLNKGIEIGVNDLFSNMRQNNGNEIRKTRTPQLIFSAFIERGYYPNTRTYLTWTNRISSATGHITSQGAVSTTSTTNEASSVLSFYYYISPQFRLMLNESLNIIHTGDYYKNNSHPNNFNLTNYLNVALNYALF